MIIRIVKMSFQPEKVADFLAVFEERKQLIRNVAGCQHLELWRDEHEKNVYFTYSIWDTEKHLNNYRFSELFKDTWLKTKVLFNEKPQAWSVQKQMEIQRTN